MNGRGFISISFTKTLISASVTFISIHPMDNQKQSQQPQLWDWDNFNYNTQNNNSVVNLANADNQVWDFQTSLLPAITTNFPLYLPVSADSNHQHLDPNGFIKVEDGGPREGKIGLNLGHRTYFSSQDSLAIDRLFRRSRGLYQLSQHVPRCQAEECKVDLSGAKHYHRRHKVCEFHSKATVVVANGLHQRFCQQCSRFHVLSEFDEMKRSCRKRLADHNRRRRKPSAQTAPIKEHQTNQICCKATVITNSASTGDSYMNISSPAAAYFHHHQQHQQQQQQQQQQHHQNRKFFINGVASGVGSTSDFPMDLV